MRELAEKLVKGQWYSDIRTNVIKATFLRFDKEEDGVYFFDSIKGQIDYEGMPVKFHDYHVFFPRHTGRY